MTDVGRKRGWWFAQVPIVAVHDQDLSAGALRTMAHLAWRQGRDESAWPSLQDLVEHLGITKRTVRNHLRELEGAGYLRTKQRDNATSLYTLIADPGKEFPIGGKGVSGGGESSFPQNNRTRTREQNDMCARKKFPKASSPSELGFEALADTCSIDYRGCDNKVRNRLNQSEGILRNKLEASPDEILEFRQWWYEEHWIGRDKGDAPRPEQVRNNWRKFIEWTEQEDEDPLDGWERVQV